MNKKEIYLPDVRKIVFLGDVACTPFTETSKRVLSEILRMETDLFLILGDVTFLGDEDEFEEIIDFCNQRATAPVFSLCGNHDISGFSKFFGLSTYALIMDKFVVLALDNARGVFEEDSLKIVEEMLHKHTEKRFIITFHVPPHTDLYRSCMKTEEWTKLKAVSDEYKERIDCILSGHIHAFQEYYLDGYRIFISGGGGAALYNLEKDPLKMHHAIEATFSTDAMLDFNVIPISV
ncbi:MAG: hypothetical protein GY774_19210 [Planctomycetes bacterium]|nr:hypothetical protein [Planctomycetota bacterium]